VGRARHHRRAAEVAGRSESSGPVSPASHVRPDRSAELIAADVLTVLAALHIAAWWAAYAGGRDAEVARYRSMARSLGDDR
jgi:hypothetical protein